jgi:hypothetical protein
MNADDFRKLVLRNPVNDALLDELMRLALPDAWTVSVRWISLWPELTVLPPSGEPAATEAAP